MAIFTLKHRPTFLVVCLLLLAFLLLLNNLHRPSKFSLFEQELFSVVSQTQKTVNSIFLLPIHIWNRYLNLLAAEEQNRLLRKEVKMLQQENSSLRESALANQRLRKLLGFKKRYPLKLVAAEVVGVDSSLYFKTIVIDKGKKDGVKKDMAVISPAGVVGRVLRVSNSFSMVLLLIDQNFALDALVQRTRARGAVEGTGGFLCRMEYVLCSKDVRCGDLVVASGLEGVFPKGIIIGKVMSITKNKRFMFQAITVKPMVEFKKLEEVLVVFNSKT